MLSLKNINNAKCELRLPTGLKMELYKRKKNCWERQIAPQISGLAANCGSKGIKFNAKLSVGFSTKFWVMHRRYTAKIYSNYFKLCQKNLINLQKFIEHRLSFRFASFMY